MGLAKEKYNPVLNEETLVEDLEIRWGVFIKVLLLVTLFRDRLTNGNGDHKIPGYCHRT